MFFFVLLVYLHKNVIKKRAPYYACRNSNNYVHAGILAIRSLAIKRRCARDVGSRLLAVNGHELHEKPLIFNGVNIRPACVFEEIQTRKSGVRYSSAGEIEDLPVSPGLDRFLTNPCKTSCSRARARCRVLRQRGFR